MAESFDFWPGAKAEQRLKASCPDGELQAEPSEALKATAVLKKSRSARAKNSKSTDEFHPPPSCVADRLAGPAARLWTRSPKGGRKVSPDEFHPRTRCATLD